ncbi:histamine N-methyltransferase-like isoform X2 [Antennarius striatus]|uniref:histamine N-methyltransferase-like isoform X2 n=1 Tax=Antennarius striatus TaxID=241820 RepID=UPI0035AFC6ED
MASSLTSVISDHNRYHKSHRIYLENSDEYQSMKNFINMLPQILASTVNTKTHLNVFGVGSGNGELDLNILSGLHLKNPEMKVNNEVVEPNPDQLQKYKDLMSQTPGLDFIKFTWSNITAEEFEGQWKEKKMTKKADLIFMFHMLYYVKDPEATISFFHSLLNKNGKLIISQVPDASGWEKLRTMHGKQFGYTENLCLTTAGIKKLLDSKGLIYKSYVVPSDLDITECFLEGNERGELLLDFLTHVRHFSQSVSPQLKAKVMESLRHVCSKESKGKVIFNSDTEVIIVESLI